MNPETLIEWKPDLVEDLACYWLLTYAPAYKVASSIKRDEGLLRKQILPTFGKLQIDQVTSRKVELWLLSLRDQERLSPKTCNEALGLFRKLYNDAARWGFVSFNPITHVRKFRIPEQSFTFWPQNEVQQFLGYFNSQPKLPKEFWAIAVSVYTGMRRGEVLALKWDCVDLNANFITCRRSYCNVKKDTQEYTKNGKIRYIPICVGLKAILEKLKQFTYLAGFVVPRVTVDTLHKVLKKLSKEVGVTPIRFHDLRHTFASNFLMGGGKIYDLQKILGHSTVQVTERYAHLVPGHLYGKTEVLGF